MLDKTNVHREASRSSGSPAAAVAPRPYAIAAASPRHAHAGGAHRAAALGGTNGGSVSQAPSPLLSLPRYLWDDIYAHLSPSDLAAVPAALPAVPKPLYEAAFLRLGLPARPARIDARTALRQAIALARSPTLWPAEIAPPAPPAGWDRLINPRWGYVAGHVVAHGDVVAAPMLNRLWPRRILPPYYVLDADAGAVVHNTQLGTFQHVYGLMAEEIIPADEGIFSCGEAGVRLTGYDNKRIWTKKDRYVNKLILGNTCVFAAGICVVGRAWDRKTGVRIYVHQAELQQDEDITSVSFALGGFVAATTDGNIFFWPEQRPWDKPQRIALQGGCILGLHVTERATLIANRTHVELYGPLLSGATLLQRWSFVDSSLCRVRAVFLVDDTAFWITNPAGTLYRAQPGSAVETFPGVISSTVSAAYANGRIYFIAGTRAFGSFGTLNLTGIAG